MSNYAHLFRLVFETTVDQISQFLFRFIFQLEIEGGSNINCFFVSQYLPCKKIGILRSLTKKKDEMYINILFLKHRPYRQIFNRSYLEIYASPEAETTTNRNRAELAFRLVVVSAPDDAQILRYERLKYWTCRPIFVDIFLGSLENTSR